MTLSIKADQKERTMSKSLGDLSKQEVRAIMREILVTSNSKDEVLRRLEGAGFDVNNSLITEQINGEPCRFAAAARAPQGIIAVAK